MLPSPTQIALVIVGIALHRAALHLASRRRSARKDHEPEPKPEKLDLPDLVHKAMSDAELAYRRIVLVLITTQAVPGTLAALPSNASQADELTLYLHPDDWRTMLLAASSAGRYYGPSSASQAVWGIPIVHEDLPRRPLIDRDLTSWWQPGDQ